MADGDNHLKRDAFDLTDQGVELGLALRFDNCFVKIKESVGSEADLFAGGPW